MKIFIIRVGLFVSLTAMFVGSFLYDYSFMNGYWQYGPFVFFAIIILFMAGYEHFFEEDPANENSNTTEKNGEPPADFHYVVRTSSLLIYVIVLASIMKLIFGAPNQSTYDVGSMDFWMLFVIIALTMSYRVWNSNGSEN